MKVRYLILYGIVGIDEGIDVDFATFLLYDRPAVAVLLVILLDSTTLHHVTDVLVFQVLAKGRVHTYPLQYLGTVAELDEL